MIQVINRALDIIEFVAEDAQRPKLLSEIAIRLNFKPGTCANIVKTLVTRGYLEKTEIQKGYTLGNKIFTLSGNTGYKKELIEAAAAEMGKLTQRINENTLLAVLSGENRLVIHKMNSKQQVQANTPDEKKAYDSSTGRLLIAMLTDKELVRFVSRFGLPSANLWKEASTEKKFYTQINLIREQGYALIEDTVQIVGFAAPVKRKDKTVASISIYLPAFRYNEKTKNDLIKNGLATAKNISVKLI
jgi:DNA-binding IclR family transcriptional regulator